MAFSNSGNFSRGTFSFKAFDSQQSSLSTTVMISEPLGNPQHIVCSPQKSKLKTLLYDPDKLTIEIIKVSSGTLK
jgi:hypothetical protein